MDVQMESRGVCCCCFEMSSYRTLWGTYSWLENSEVYGQMIKDCFNIDYMKVVKPGVEDHICEACINKLRHTTMFRKQVMRCHSVLEAQALDMVKTERDSDNILFESADVKPKLDVLDYEEVDDLGDMENESGASELITVEPELRVVSKRRAKLKGGQGLTTTSKSNKSKTSSNKGRPEKDGPSFREMNRQYRHNISLLLQHSTICPFNSNQTYFMCIYCSQQYVNFDQLRDHVLELHGHVDHSKVHYKIVKRNCKRMKAEVSDMKCKICTKACHSLDDLVAHLTDTHNIQFMNDVSKPTDCVVGFELRYGKYRCSVCKEEFQYFKTLSIHMNEHYTDFVCDTCGKNFLALGKLRMHQKTHNKTLVRCQYCQKVLAASALKQHLKYTHMSRTYMCSVCKEVFKSEKLRMDHLVEQHGRPRPNTSCDICLRNFSCKTSLEYHMRTSHLHIPEAKHPCPDCGKLFSNPRMKRHSLVHTGEKRHECTFCHKKFGRRSTLNEHLKIHNNDKRWSCVVCAQTFVQKCSLKNHIKVHHKEYSGSEQLMVYNPAQ